MPLLQISARQPDGSPVLEEGESVIGTEPNVALFFNSAAPEGVGTLFVTSKHVIWLDASDAGKGYSMDYYFISIHALSTDTSDFPHPCIYCQLESEETPEARFVLQNHNNLQPVFKAFCDGALLNPDAEEEGEGDFIYNEEEVQRGLTGESFFNNGDNTAMDEGGRFEDCDEEEDDGEEAENEEEKN